MIDRFWSKVDKSGECWNWTGARTAPGWHGMFASDATRAGRTMVLAHRHSWALANGPVPDGLNVLHRCDNAGCVRPDHLFLGTHSDNMRDRSAKGRANNRLWTVCKRGHPFENNTYIHPTTGRRACQTCITLRSHLRSTDRAAELMDEAMA